jgi:hypothetical protein
MPVSPRKRRANQVNASKSTGPRTKEGKLRSRQNAIRRGVFATDVVLPGEDHEAHRALLRDAIDSLRPQDALQMSVVERIVAAEWRLRRLREVHRWLHDGRFMVLRAETLDDARGPAERAAAEQQLSRLPAGVITALLLQDENDALERLAKHEQRLELSIQRSLRQLRELQNPKVARPDECPYAPADGTPPPPRWPAEEEPATPHDAKCENEPTEARVSRNIEVASAGKVAPPRSATPSAPRPPE